MSYYLERGVEPDKIINLTDREKTFYLASALFWAEQKSKQFGI